MVRAEKVVIPVKSKVKDRVFSIMFSVLRLYGLLIIGYIVLYPLFYMLSTSLKTQEGFLDVSHQWLPLTVTPEHFKTAFEIIDFKAAFRQTFVLQILSAGLEIFVCSFVAYGFARFTFPGKKIATFFLILSLLIPVQMYSLSLAVNYRQLQIFNTPFAYWLPSFFGVGIRSGILIFIYMQFFTGLPRELEDAASVDGAGPIRTYFKIALPSSSVAIVTVSVLSFIWHWNENYLAELCFLDENRPLAVVLSNIKTLLSMEGVWQGSSPLYPAIVFAACLLFIAVPLILYMIVQRKFVKSIDRVGITG